MRIPGFFFDGQSSKRHTAHLVTQGQGDYAVHYDDQIKRYDAAELQINPRLGNSARLISLPAGAQFETDQQEAVDLLRRRMPRQPHSLSWLHGLESRWQWVLGSVIVLFFAVYLGVQHGIPWTAKRIVSLLPDATGRVIGEESMRFLDNAGLDASGLSPARQQALQDHFAPMLAAHPKLTLTVHFRDAPGIGANAFALPSGDMVFTDQMIEMAQNDDELSSILAHEIGHVYHQHSLRRIVQSSMVYWGVMTLTGDLSGASDTLAAAPAYLFDLSYSREMETEADEFALMTLKQQGIAPIHFANIMQRIDAKTRHSQRAGRLLSLLSTHPDTPERIKRFQSESP